MAQDPYMNHLARQLRTGQLTRRDLLRRAAALGLSLPAVSALLAACGGGDDETTPAGGATSPAGGASPRAGSPVASPRATPAGSPGAGTPTAYTLENPPSVANADQASQYAGVRLTYYGDTVGIGGEIDRQLGSRFQEETGIEINIVPRPQSATESYATYQRFFQARSPDVDVMMIDVIWPGAFAPHLLDLSEAMGDEAQLHYETIIQNNTVDGKLVAMPWFGDFGMLYYRTDLLETYGFDGPPRTWEELEEQARTIVEGERGANPNIAGFVFQGNAYEGLTCNALEWIASTGGGTIVDTQGNVTLDNDNAKATLNLARGWVGGIAPRGVTSYLEEDARNVFQGGNAAFMRNWPYAYALAASEDSAVRGNFDVAPLPATEGEEPVGTVGGWQLAVSAHSRNPEAAIEFVRYLASPEVQTYRAVVGSFVPTIQTVAEDPVVVEALPFLQKMGGVVRVTRPSAAAGERYNELSTVFFQGVSQILNGADANQVVPQMVPQIERTLR